MAAFLGRALTDPRPHVLRHVAPQFLPITADGNCLVEWNPNTLTYTQLPISYG